jgi:hypothetical protein
MLLLAPASPETAPPLAFNGIAGGVRSTPVCSSVLALKVRAFSHQAGCDLCQFVRSAPSSELSAAPHPNGGPSRIILMRHADKPDDPDDPDLSAAGVTRAEHLATYIPQTFGKPDLIFATARSKHSDRPVETVGPLAQAVGLSIQHDIKDKDFEDLVDEIFSDPVYHGKTVVICWLNPEVRPYLELSGGPYTTGCSGEGNSLKRFGHVCYCRRGTGVRVVSKIQDEVIRLIGPRIRVTPRRRPKQGCDRWQCHNT